MQIWIMVVLAAVAIFILAKTPFGRAVYAVGGNERAAELAGVPVKRVKIRTYMIAGFCAAIAGLVTASQLTSAIPSAGETFELNAIAACVIGGASLMGGRGTVRGVLLGAFVIGFLGDGLVNLNVSTFWQTVVKGAIIILAVMLDQAQQRIKSQQERGARRGNVNPLRRRPPEFRRVVRDAIRRETPDYKFVELGTKRKVQYMIRKKLFAFAAIASFAAIAMAGCSSDDTTTTSAAPTADEGGLIAVIVPSLDNPFFAAEGEGAVAEAEKLGYTTSYQSHDDDAQKQSDLIDAAIEAGAVAIILDNAGADDSIGAVQRATDAGIGVFLIDREINATGIAKAQIVADNAQGATAVAETWVAALPDGGKYIELTGKETDTNAGVRSAGFNSVIAQHPNLVLAAKQTANWSQDEAFTVMETLLQANPDVVGVIAGNDTMALGAVAAIDAAGLTGKVTVAGFDGSPDAVDAIKAGTMLVTGLQPVLLSAQLAVQQADQWLKTGSTGQPEKQSINCFNITKDNADKYSNWSLSS